MASLIITIAQQKGGAGKTTVAAHIAVALSQKGNRVAIVDIDPQGSLAHWHKIREEKFGEGYTGLTFPLFPSPHSSVFRSHFARSAAAS